MLFHMISKYIFHMAEVLYFNNNMQKPLSWSWGESPSKVIFKHKL